jgi:hypothetical protein
VRDAKVAHESLRVEREEAERRDEDEQKDDVLWGHAQNVMEREGVG